MSYDREMSPLFDPTSSLPLFIPNDKENESNNSCLVIFTIILKILEMFEMLLKLMGMGHTPDSHTAFSGHTSLNAEFLSYQF